MNKAKISVIMPVFNAENYLKKSIESVLNQTYKNIELIIIDDNSTDNSENIILDYVKKDSRVRYVKNEKKGVSNARNTGLDLSSGEYITFIDADDYIDLNTLDEMKKYIQINNSDICMAGYIEESKKKSLKHILPWSDGTNFDSKKIKNEIIPKIIAIEKSENKEYELIMGSVWRLLINNELIIKSKIKFNSEIHIAEDLIFCVELLGNAKSLVITQQCFYNYVRYEDTTVEKYREHFIHENLNFAFELEKLLKKLDIWNENMYRFYIRKAGIYTMSVSNYFRYNSPKTYRLLKSNIKAICQSYNNDMMFNEMKSCNISYDRKIALMLIQWRCVGILIFMFKIKQKIRKRYF